MKKWLALSVWTVFVAVVSALITTAYFQNFVLTTTTTLPAEKPQAIRELSETQIAASPVTDENAIIEVFSYACSYCAAREKDMAQLERKLPAGKRLIRLHIAGEGSKLARFAEVFATLNTMGIEDELRASAYDAVLTQRLDLSDRAIRNQWLVDNAVSPTLYDLANQSSSTRKQLEYMKKVSEFYAVRGTPSFIVNKKWIVVQDRPAPEFKEHLLSLLNQE